MVEKKVHPILEALTVISQNPETANLDRKYFEADERESKPGDVSPEELIEASQMILTDRELTDEEAKSSAQIVNLIADAMETTGQVAFIDILRSLKREENWGPVKEEVNTIES